MKNLLKSTMYLTVFALAGILFQISCSNSDKITQTLTANSTPIGKIVYTKKVSNQLQIWTCDYNGTNQAQIPISLPANVAFNYWIKNNSTNSADESNVKLSPDGQKVFFQTVTNPNQNNQYFSIYSCDISGNNLVEIVTQASGQDPLVIGGAY